MCGGGAGGTGLAAASGPRLEVNAAASSSSPNSGLEGSRYGSAAVGLTSGSGVEVFIGPELGGGLSLGGGEAAVVKVACVCSLFFASSGEPCCLCCCEERFEI